MSDIDYAKLDREDSLAHLRELFALPENTVYLDGNSLGAAPHRVAERLAQVVAGEWGRDLVSSWNRHDWIGMPARVGERIARLIGAATGQVICTDSTSVNIFKLLCTALALQPGRRVVLSQQDNFPTDLYMAEGLSNLLGSQRCELRTVPAAELEQALDQEVAVLMLTQVNFRDGSLHDMRALTTAAHNAGALVLWDLAHSAGVIPLELDAWQVDLAVGCGYKFLNGGPGAPAFVYVASRHQERAEQPLSGWMGHRAAFDFNPHYAPADGVDRYLGGTPGILSMCALEAALEVFDQVTVPELYDKACALTGLFMDALAAAGLDTLRMVTPRDASRRGSQVSLAHPEAFAISQALIAADVVVDFREPDIVRFGFAPLYTRFRDVEAALDALIGIMRDQRYRQPQYRRRSIVT